MEWLGQGHTEASLVEQKKCEYALTATTHGMYTQLTTSMNRQAEWVDVPVACDPRPIERGSLDSHAFPKMSGYLLMCQHEHPVDTYLGRYL